MKNRANYIVGSNNGVGLREMQTSRVTYLHTKHSKLDGENTCNIRVKVDL